MMRRLGQRSRAMGRVWAMGRIEKAWAGLGVSEVGEAVSDLGRRQVVPS